MPGPQRCRSTGGHKASKQHALTAAECSQHNRCIFLDNMPSAVTLVICKQGASEPSLFGEAVAASVCCASLPMRHCTCYIIISSPIMNLKYFCFPIYVLLLLGRTSSFIIERKKRHAPLAPWLRQPRKSTWAPFSTQQRSNLAILFDNKGTNNNSDFVNDIYGVNIERGGVLFALVFLLTLWQFSIPPEFRRARFCSDYQVRLYPQSKCITPENWAKGIKEYYQQGGGIQWDFSIEGRE